MKLVHPDLSGSILEKDVLFTEWIIEAPELFLRFVREMKIQCEGGEGDFVLSKENKILNLSKHAELLIDPLSIDINQRKMISKLHAELLDISRMEHVYLKTQAIRQNIQEYFMLLEQETEYILNINPEIEMSALFKALDIKFEVYEEDFLDQLVRYVKAANKVLGITLFIFVNLRSFLNDEQIISLLKEAGYQEIKIVLMENRDNGCIGQGFRYIIDSDKCEIY